MLGLTQHLMLSEVCIRRAWLYIPYYIYRMRLRVKPAKTQIVSYLEGSGIKGLKDVM